MVDRIGLHIGMVGVLGVGIAQIQMKIPDFDDNMILPEVPCGDFANGLTKLNKIPKLKFDMEIKNHIGNKILIFLSHFTLL